MKLLVNGTTLTVSNAYAERDKDIKVFIHVPQSEMEYAELKALFKENTGDIEKTADDGTTELFSGFSYTSIVDDEENETYIVTLTGNEYDFQIGRNRMLEAKAVEYEQMLSTKDSEISELLEVAEQYAEMLYKESLGEIESETVKTESEVL